ncbi:MAG: hypothetical protein PVI23_08345 [Maricaulaceae bacterium]|jgi:hypothetical protein
MRNEDDQDGLDGLLGALALRDDLGMREIGDPATGVGLVPLPLSADEWEARSAEVHARQREEAAAFVARHEAPDRGDDRRPDRLGRA